MGTYALLPVPTATTLAYATYFAAPAERHTPQTRSNPRVTLLRVPLCTTVLACQAPSRQAVQKNTVLVRTSEYSIPCSRRQPRSTVMPLSSACARRTFVVRTLFVRRASGKDD